jgi:hypothetical protein
MGMARKLAEEMGRGFGEATPGLPKAVAKKLALAPGCGCSRKGP